jgi:hypothetical protein
MAYGDITEKIETNFYKFKANSAEKLIKYE